MADSAIKRVKQYFILSKLFFISILGDGCPGAVGKLAIVYIFYFSAALPVWFLSNLSFPGLNQAFVWARSRV
jgi:hypothetical protein